jgi:hypothetical protein
MGSIDPGQPAAARVEQLAPVALQHVMRWPTIPFEVLAREVVPGVREVVAPVAQVLCLRVPRDTTARRIRVGSSGVERSEPDQRRAQRVEPGRCLHDVAGVRMDMACSGARRWHA